jgi:hypothetical protein
MSAARSEAAGRRRKVADLAGRVVVADDGVQRVDRLIRRVARGHGVHALCLSRLPISGFGVTPAVKGSTNAS